MSVAALAGFFGAAEETWLCERSLYLIWRRRSRGRICRGLRAPGP